MRVAIETRKPQIKVFGLDGFGGVVARLVPGQTGCFHCFSVAVDEKSVGYPVAAAEGARPPVQPRGCAAPTFVSTGPELARLVSQAMIMAFAHLCEGDFPTMLRDVYVFQLRNPDGTFLDAPTWSSYSLPRRPDCPVCSAAVA